MCAVDNLAAELTAANEEIMLTEVATALTVLAYDPRAAMRAGDRRQLRRSASGNWESRCSSAVPWARLPATPTERDVAASLGGAPWRLIQVG